MRHAKKTLMALLFFLVALLPEILLLPHLQHRKTLCPAKSLRFYCFDGTGKSDAVPKEPMAAASAAGVSARFLYLPR